MDPMGRLIHHFSSEVPKEVMDLILSSSENPIYELELAPILTSIKLRGSFFVNSQVVMCLDI